MSTVMRPDSMERITTPELAKAFIEEQVAAIRAQVGAKKVLLALALLSRSRSHAWASRLV